MNSSDFPRQVGYGAIKEVPIAITFDTADRSKSAPFPYIGKLTDIAFVIPNWTNDVTLSVAYRNGHQVEMFSCSGLARGTKPHLVMLDVPAYEDGEFVATLSAAPGGPGGTLQLYLSLDQWVEEQ